MFWRRIASFTFSMFLVLALSSCRNPGEAGILIKDLVCTNNPFWLPQSHFSACPVQDAEPTGDWGLITSPSDPLTSQVVCQHMLVLFPLNSPPLFMQLCPLYTFPVTHNTAHLLIFLSDNCIWWKGEEGCTLQEIYWKLMAIKNSPLQKEQDNTQLPGSWHWEQISQHNNCSALCALSIYNLTAWDPQAIYTPHKFSSKRRIWDMDLIPVRCAIHFPFMNTLGKHCEHFFGFLLFFSFDLSRNKWAPGKGLTWA